MHFWHARFPVKLYQNKTYPDYSSTTTAPSSNFALSKPHLMSQRMHAFGEIIAFDHQPLKRACQRILLNVSFTFSKHCWKYLLLSANFAETIYFHQILLNLSFAESSLVRTVRTVLLNETSHESEESRDVHAALASWRVLGSRCSASTLCASSTLF